MMAHHILNLHSSMANPYTIPPPSSGCTCPYKNLIKNSYLQGCISGMVGIILSHPIDSIKTHRQTLNKIPFNYSLKNLYKGVSSPLIGVGIEKALVFGTYKNCKEELKLNTPISGAIAGLVASLVVSPYERIKILAQTSQTINLKMCLKPSFLFKGLSTTFTREVPGFAIYFSTYENLKQSYIDYYRKDISLCASFIFGGMSGGLAWVFIYPQDRIKTIIQSQQEKSSIRNIVRTIYANGGIRQFYTGFSLALGRALLLHSGTFCMMEYLNKKIINNK